jgi:uncharacterized DUF497 family protein
VPRDVQGAGPLEPTFGFLDERRLPERSSWSCGLPGLSGLRRRCKSNTLTTVDFSWDERKAAANLKKHGVSFGEAATVFADPLALAIDDVEDPERTLLLGMSDRQRLLLVVHAELDESTIRIISARRASSQERRRYEEEGH